MGVQVVMPRLGQPVEPSRVQGVDPWWRSVATETHPPALAAETPPKVDAAVYWLID